MDYRLYEYPANVGFVLAPHLLVGIGDYVDGNQLPL